MAQPSGNLVSTNPSYSNDPFFNKATFASTPTLSGGGGNYGSTPPPSPYAGMAPNMQGVASDTLAGVAPGQVNKVQGGTQPGLVKPPIASTGASTGTQTNGSTSNNLNATGGGVNTGGLVSQKVGIPFTFGSSQYVKNADGSISPYSGSQNAPPPTSAPTNLNQGAAGGGGQPFQGRYSFDSSGSVTGTESQTQPTPNTPAPVTANDINSATPTQFPSLVSTLATTAANQSPEYQSALQDYNQQKVSLQNLQSQFGTQYGNTLNEGTDKAEAFGEQGAISNAEALQSAPLTQRMQADTAVLSAATGQQSAQQNGLGAAAGLVHPVTGVPYGTQTIQPGNLGSTGGAGVSPSDPFYQSMQTYANMMVNGQISSIPSSISGNPALQAQLVQMAQKINPNFNINQATATGQSQQSQTQQQQQYQSSAQQATNLGSQLNQLINQAGINPSDLNALNSFVQKVATNTSDPNYQTFQNLVNDMANTYAQVLTPSGGSTTDMVRNISQSLLNASQSGQSILQVMKNLDAQVQAKISGVTTAYGKSGNKTSGSSGWSSLGD